MSHHGDEPFRDFDGERNKLMRELLNTTGFRGTVGSYPDGVLRKRAEDDDGLIQFAVGIEDDKVVIDFGTPVAWLGMTPQQAADFASSILNRAREAGRKAGETVTFKIGA